MHISGSLDDHYLTFFIWVLIIIIITKKEEKQGGKLLPRSISQEQWNEVINTEALQNTQITKMPSVIEPQQNRAELQTNRSNPPLKRNSLQHHFERVPKEKMVLPPRGNINPKFQEKARVVKKSSVQPIPLKSSKPWPGSDNKATTSKTKKDEIIKHMSNVPSYLQKNIQNGNNISSNNIQGKALNFGVLEWGALEKYTTQKQRDVKVRENSAKKPNLDLNTNLKFKSKDEFRKQELGFVAGPSFSSPNINGENSFDLCESPLNTVKIQNEFSSEFIYQTPIKIPHSCPNLPYEEGDLSNDYTKTHEKSKRGINIIERLDRVSEFNQINRSLSLKESNNSNNNGDKESSNKKGRQQSPLRRMLDPLLKHNKTPTLNKESNSLNMVRKSVDGINKTLIPKIETSTLYPKTETCINTAIENEKNECVNKQALLQVAWKNGLPLFMLSSGDSDILAATIKTKSFSLSEKNMNNNQESFYSIFTVQESKKKGGGSMWMNKQGSKNKKQQLVSNVVGEVKVSLSKSKCGTNSQNYHFSRQFILLVETKPSEENSNSKSNSESESQIVNKSELAAIITNLPQRDCFCSKKSNITAILPSGIHGYSNSGKPLALIERWKRKGGCDCGGWDEGCMLSILTNHYFHETNNSNNDISAHRFELFNQGRSKEEGSVFSMTCFKEGLYTVKFKSSVDLVQAFVMCISFLHGKNPMKEKTELEGQEEQVQLFVRKSAASYVPHHPPLSPVGRA